MYFVQIQAYKGKYLLVQKNETKNMTRFYKPALLLLLSGVTMVSSCKKSDYTYPVVPNTATYGNELKDDFNSDTHNWSYSDAGTSVDVFIANGMLNFTSHPTTTATGYVLSTIETGISSANAYSIEASFVSDNIMGISFGSNDTSMGYSFKLNQNGDFAVYYEGSRGAALAPELAVPILDWTHASNVSKGLLNTFKIEQVGHLWSGYINNVRVFQITAKPILSNKAGYLEINGTTGQADYLDVKW